MYVVPFLMGPPGSRFSKVGVEITDSRYVVLNMRIMTRVGQVALDHLGDSRRLHALPALARRPQPRSPLHHALPRGRTPSGRSARATAATRCSARSAWRCGWRAGSARKEGWLAEHMLILGLEDPAGADALRRRARSRPRAARPTWRCWCRRTSMPGWKATTVGDDIAWLRPATDGRLWAVNPEAGFFGVVPGTSRKTNPTAIDMIQRNTIFTNVALRPDGTPWWEGHDDPPPAEALDWQGRPWTPASTEKAAHPNSRFTDAGHAVRDALAGVRQPERRADRRDPVRRAPPAARAARLSRRATGSTARSSAPRCRRRRPPRRPARSACCGAIRWRCCRSAATTWATTSSTGSTSARRWRSPPKIFRVNWFRTGDDGKFLWPGFGDNLRVLKWILERCDGRGNAVETPIGARADARRHRSHRPRRRRRRHDARC